MTTDKQAAVSARTDRARPAQARLVAAFNAMLLARDGERRRPSAVAARAGVSRTTFYDHFQNSEELELVALRRSLAALTELAVNNEQAAAAEPWLVHFWEYRSEVRRLLSGLKRARVERQLEAMIREQMPNTDSAAVFETQAAATIIALLDAWVHARIIATPIELTMQVSASCAALRHASNCN